MKAIVVGCTIAMLACSGLALSDESTAAIRGHLPTTGDANVLNWTVTYTTASSPASGSGGATTDGAHSPPTLNYGDRRTNTWFTYNGNGTYNEHDEVDRWQSPNAAPNAPPNDGSGDAPTWGEVSYSEHTLDNVGCTKLLHVTCYAD